MYRPLNSTAAAVDSEYLHVPYVRELKLRNLRGRHPPPFSPIPYLRFWLWWLWLSFRLFKRLADWSEAGPWRRCQCL